MLEAIIYILIGMFVGWNLPQPIWAKGIQEKIMSWINRKDKDEDI